MNNFHFKYLKYKSKYESLKEKSINIVICPYCGKINQKKNNYCLYCEKSLIIQKKIDDNHLIFQNNNLTCWLTPFILFLYYGDFELDEEIELFITETLDKLKEEDICQSLPKNIREQIDYKNLENNELFIKSILKLSHYNIIDIKYDFEDFIKFKKDDNIEDINLFFYDFFKFYNKKYKIDLKSPNNNSNESKILRTKLIEKELERISKLDQDINYLKKNQFEYLEDLLKFNRFNQNKQIKRINCNINTYIPSELIYKFLFSYVNFNVGLLKIISPINQKEYFVCIKKLGNKILYCNPWNNKCKNFKIIFEDKNLNFHFPKFYIIYISLYINNLNYLNNE